jgi:signal transduction histidine kinase
MKRPRSITSRLLLTVVAAVGVALVLMIAGFNVALDRTLSSNANEVLHARASAELALLSPASGGLVLHEAADPVFVDTPIFVFAGGRVLEAPRTDATVARAARSLTRGPARTLEVPASDTRLLSAPVFHKGSRLGTVVAAVSMSPYRQTQKTALLASLALGGLLLLVVALAARWLLASSFRPVARMTGQAAAWSERDIDRRFGLGDPHDELTRLAATLDGLLDRLAASLRREQRFSAEVSHELRTPLAGVIAEAELALRRERTPEEYRAAMEVVLRSARHIARTVEALVAASQHESGAVRGTADAYAVAEETAAAAASLASERKLDLVAERPSAPLRLGVDRDLAERILQPIVENACRYGASRVRIALRRDAAHVLYVVEDDGPGVLAEERESIFEPGTRGSVGRAANGDGGAGLGLALARRLARTASGEVEAEATARGARFVVTLPAA